MASWIDGLALAATIAGDREGSAVRDGLAPGVRDALAGRLATLTGPAREPALRAVAAALRPPVVSSPGAGARALPPRAAAILAPEVPRELGAQWIAAAGAPRAGFRATAALRAQLRRLVRADDPAARAAREREELGWRG